MDSPFIYNTIVTGADFIPREREYELLVAAILEHRSAVLFEPHKSGKESLITHTLDRLRHKNYPHRLCRLSLFNVRSKEALVKKFEEKLENCLPLPPSMRTVQVSVADYLSEANRRAQLAETNLIIVIDEFQEILNIDNSDDILKKMEQELSRIEGKHTSVILCGSFVNAMHAIFSEKKYFYNLAEVIRLNKIDEKSFIDYIVRYFLKAGRVVPKELASQIYNLTEGHPWYTQQLADIAFGLTRGYLTEKIIDEAHQNLNQFHSYRFKILTSRLSNYQITFLRAVIDNVKQFCSKETLATYSLQSSANVNRIIEALKRKEILEFHKDGATFQDPIFKSWLQKYYF